MTNEEPTTASQRLVREHHAAQRKQYAKGMALIALAVIAGAVIGVGGTLLYVKNRMHRIPPHPKAIGDAMLGHMRGLIALTPDEESRIKTIIDAHVGEVDAMRKESFGNIRAVFRRMDDQVAEILGPERMKVWKEDKEKRFGRRRHDDRK